MGDRYVGASSLLLVSIVTWRGMHSSVPPVSSIHPDRVRLVSVPPVGDVCVRVVQKYNELAEGGRTADIQEGAADVVDHSPGSTGAAALPTDKHVPGTERTAVDHCIAQQSTVHSNKAGGER